METTKTTDIEETKDEIALDVNAEEPKKLSAAQKKKLKAKQKKEAEKQAQETGQKQVEAPITQEEADDDESTEHTDVEASAQDAAKKKKKKKPAKKTGTEEKIPLRVLGEWKADAHPKQTSYPPDVPMTKQFTKGAFPEGEILEHPLDLNRHRITSAELRAKERLFESDYDDLRRAAEVHRQTRRYAQSFIKPGMKIMDICNEIEACNRRLIEASGLEAGIAFPTGASLNHVAAHYTPNLGDERVLEYGDVMKIDYGSHIRGLMTDCAFTVAFDPTYDNLLLAVKDATNTGIKAAGIDVRLTDIGEAIQETMESYEVTIKNKTYPVKCIQNLCGHSIQRYRIHAGKSVPIVKNGDNTKMEEGEQYAIETFGSTGKGWVNEDVDCSHYMLDFNAPTNPILRSSTAKALFYTIRNNFGTLAFARKWLEQVYPKHIGPLRQLCDAKVVNAYPPLADTPGCYTAQFEHTILLRATCKEVLTRGPDY